MRDNHNQKKETLIKLTIVGRRPCQNAPKKLVRSARSHLEETKESAWYKISRCIFEKDTDDHDEKDAEPFARFVYIVFVYLCQSAC